MRGILPVLLLAVLVFLPLLGSVHLFDWDEFNFAQAAREMSERGDYLTVTIAGQPFYEKPPLFFWLQAMASSLLGDSEASARLPSAIASIMTALMLFLMGRRWKDEKQGLLWAGFYLGSFLPLVTGRMGLIDPVFNFWIALGLFLLFELDRREERVFPLAMISGLSLGLAVLSKGPLGAGIPIAIFVIYRLIKRDFHLRILPFSLFLLALVLSAASWFLMESLVNGGDFIREFVRYQVRLLQTQDAGHGGFPGYEFLIFLLGCFPLSVFALRFLFRKESDPSLKDATLLARVWLLFVLLLFALVKTKIPHYTSLVYMPGAWLAAREVRLLANSTRLSKLTLIFWVLVGGLISLLLIALPALMRNPDAWIHLIEDEFTRANILRPVPWSPLALIPGLLFALGTLVSLLWVFRGNWQRGTMSQGFTVGLCVLLSWPFLLPKIEAHSQGGAIALYESLREEPADLCIAGFKSYAHLYTMGRRAWSDRSAEGRERLMTATDRPLYIVTPLHRTEEIQRQYPSRILRREGGFVLLLREPLP
ncbi:MAG: glycosyltransferase family 39 protein [Candidatus Krumholzibacteria bacterium]|jgi:hypothetical protein|nr:glycosyltransferase family 39 protein [Candidatus Krumholzibacteria bacterium]MDP6797941.1 glycosyltransferase family 39 protein [Candidatus Krumholzibacteria bacterium]MDP7021101.1 glycosyltransferase family 39 protein [Candidatus Krumholzibacteria bacterium]